MASKKSKTPKEEYTFVEAKVTGYEVRSEASLNYALRDPRPLLSRDDDLAYEFVTTIDISASHLDPSERKGDTLNLTLRGEEIHPGDFSRTLEDFQVRDEDRIPQFRTYCGEQYPVYLSPPGLAVLNKRRGEKIWDTWLNVAPGIVSDMLALLGQDRPLFVSIHEKKTGRDRWIQSFSIQTADPREE